MRQEPLEDAVQTGVRKTEADLQNEVGQSLAAWLNSPERDETRESVRRLLEGLKTNQWSTPLREAWQEVAGLVARYRCQRVFRIFVGQSGEKTFLIPHFQIQPIIAGSSRSERRLIDQMATLCDRGLLGRVTCCQRCRTWFYGVRDDQKFCKRDCKVAFEHDSPEYKDYQRRKQAERYQLKKQEKVRIKGRKR
jgi:hypothetical protein